MNTAAKGTLLLALIVTAATLGFSAGVKIGKQESYEEFAYQLEVELPNTLHKAGAGLKIRRAMPPFSENDPNYIWFERLEVRAARNDMPLVVDMVCHDRGDFDDAVAALAKIMYESTLKKPENKKTAL